MRSEVYWSRESQGETSSSLLPSVNSTWKWHRESFHWGGLEVQALLYLILFCHYKWQSPDYFIQESATHTFFEECEKSSRSLKGIKYKEATLPPPPTKYKQYQACKSSFLMISVITVNLRTFRGQILYTGRVGMEASLSEMFYMVLKGLHSTRDCFCYVTVPCFC